MEEIIKKSKELKLTILDEVERHLNYNLSCKDLLDLAQCLNYIEEDKTYYERLLTKFSNNMNGYPNGLNGYGSGETLLFNSTEKIDN